MRTYYDFPLALKALQSHGGAMLHQTSLDETRWLVGTFKEVDKTSPFGPRKATENALSSGGLTKEEVASELRDWTERNPPEKATLMTPIEEFIHNAKKSGRSEAWIIAECLEAAIDGVDNTQHKEHAKRIAIEFIGWAETLRDVASKCDHEPDWDSLRTVETHKKIAYLTVECIKCKLIGAIENTDLRDLPIEWK